MEMFASGVLIQNLFMPRKPKQDGSERKPTTGGVIIGSDYDAERTRKIKAEADAAELNVAKIKGQLVMREDVIKAWESVLHATRAKLLALPAKFAPMLANESDPAVVKDVLEGGINEALAELANYQPEVDATKTAGDKKKPEKKKAGRPKKIDAALRNK